MVRQSYTAVIARNDLWQDEAATEPYEAGWAAEAVLFIRLLAVEGALAGAEARVQISPDGLRWVDEGTRIPLPADTSAVTFGRVSQFGQYLRLATTLPAGASCKALVTLSLKA